ncbi:uncharacterized protein SETTUDRAFT_165894 [Exserohilum turcica Et28A]|uniref:Uncharacterized protein n=1 Tax=Exserohilum turcicum (strain 28A) TaxID=671987 RepID=R0JV79_EXST2|nr:uncharacterized protein SETTUDRAFT_165894 [Exserohilum turcica Et28A]EOA81409.1 hypothetical protein SETTUDRAFT_165894 [Exserohilum turcica Et28A]
MVIVAQNPHRLPSSPNKGTRAQGSIKRPSGTIGRVAFHNGSMDSGVVSKSDIRCRLALIACAMCFAGTQACLHQFVPPPLSDNAGAVWDPVDQTAAS